MSLSLEVAVFSGSSALKAQALGAQRVEMNAPGSYDQGGLTPPVRELVYIADRLTIPIRIMIRPRGPPASGSDFIYDDNELVLMQRAIEEFKGLNIMNPVRGDAFVFGIIKPEVDGEDSAIATTTDMDTETLVVDEDRCNVLVEAARPLGCVFHRAFDPIAASNRWSKGIDALLRCNFEGLLTAGGAGIYSDNLERLDQMCLRAKGKLQIIAGGGVRHHNVAHPASHLGTHKPNAVWLHSAALASTDGPPDEDLDTDELLALLANLAVARPD